MKQLKTGFWFRLKEGIKYIFTEKRNLFWVTYCEQCGSMDVMRVTSTTTHPTNYAIEYRAEYVCNRCKARAQVVQVWCKTREAREAQEDKK